MTIGIYKITNIVNGKIYIGKSLNIEQRFNRHINDLNRNSNHNPHFQNAWNKYGEDKFKFEIIHTLEVYDEEKISELEIYYISKYNSTDEHFGYNFQCGGQGGKLSERQKEFIRENSKFKNASLTKEQVIEIKLALYCLMDRKELAKMYNVDISIIKSIAEIKNYYYVCEELNDKIKNIKQKLINERNKEVINLYNDGYRIVDICNKLDLNRGTVEHILYDRKLHIGRKNQKILKYENIYNEVIRLHNEGFINYHIAKQLNVSPSTVRRYIDKYNNQQANTEVSQEIKES